MPAGRFIEILRTRAAETPDRVAFVFRDEATEREFTYAELDRRARALAVALAEGGSPGDRVLLACSPGVHYVAGFFGCLYAGMIAVPVYPPNDRMGAERMLRVLLNSEARSVVVDRVVAGRIRSWPDRLATVRVVVADEAPLDAADAWRPVAVRPGEPAFLQYTSGSTADPKGVMVGHDNLTHNAATMAEALGFGPDTVSVSWLPPYHDMGLIGGILQPVYSGFRAVLLSPMSFLRRPARWLNVISEHRATASVAPAFGYAECTRRLTDDEIAALDLSSWRTALVGAEPIPPVTLEAFAERFRSAGFRKSAFYPCYGLAEATLFVTGGERDRAPVISETSGTRVVACGTSRGTDTVLVVDQETRVPCANDVIGEIWVSGPTVAHGYWRDPGRTEEVFEARLADGDPRTFLRTGDLGFFADGELHITGRAKEIIVLRGHNHYPQDIEWTAELAHPSLPKGRGAAFAVRSGTAERAVLVQEVGAGFRQAADEVVAAIRAAVAVAHGIDLHDVVLVRRGSIPRTSSGKIRRLATRDRYTRGEFVRLSHSGRLSEPVDLALHGAVAAVLDRPAGRVDPELPLVAQGLDSVRAVEVKSLLLNDFNLDVALVELLAGGTTNILAQMPRDGDRRTVARPRAESFAASSGQARLWLLDRLGKSEAFRVGAGLRIRGPLALPALHAAVTELVARHEALRTTLEMAADGAIRQRVHPPVSVRLPVFELSVPDEAMRQREIVACYWRELGEPFDLGSQPLLRVAVIRFAPDDAAVLLSAHHVAVDGWSMTVLWHELAALYEAFSTGRPSPLPAPEAPYRDLPAGDADMEFWRRLLYGAPELLLPTDRPRTGHAGEGGAVAVQVSADLTRRLRELAAEENATLHMVLVAAFAAVLARWGDQPDVVFASVWANRADPLAAGVVGFLAQALPVRVDTGGDVSFRDLVARARSCCLEVLAHQHTPVELALGGRRQETVALGLRPALPAWRGDDLAVEAFEIPPSAAQFDLSVELAETSGDTLRGWAVFAAELFDESTVRRIFSAFVTLLESAADDPDRQVSALPLIDRAERERIAGFGDPHAALPEPPPVTLSFESRVDSDPDATALVEGATRITYRELDERANRLARYLVASGVRREEAVGVYLPHSVDAVVCLLAVLKAGAAYLPMDAAYPPAQLAYVIEDARPPIVLSRGDVLVAGGPVDAVMAKARLVRLDLAASEIAACSPDRIPLTSFPDCLSYVIYTSGSTGRPKGTANTHRGLGNLMRWRCAQFPLRAGDGVLQRTPLGFDVSVLEIVWPLVSGARLVIPPVDGYRDPRQWNRLIRAERVTDCCFVPSVLKVFLDELDGESCPLVRVHLLGEELTPELVAATHRTMPLVEMHNTYGPAETAIEVTHEAVDPAGANVPIGSPIPGVRIRVLDRVGNPVPIGVPGEVFIGGACLSRGYLHQPSLTAERFVPDPTMPGERLYRTGDLAKWLPDGRLVFAGRVDQQVKIRGQRVEPAGVRAALLTYAAIREAVVVARPRSDGDQELVAYLVFTGPPPPVGELRSYLLERLPRFMIPQAFVVVPRIPLSPNGKLDRNALPDPRDGHLGAPVSRREPATAAERMMAEIWASVLDTDDIGRDDEFRELGGHSLMATQMAARIGARFGVEMSVAELLDRSWTLTDLAGEVQRRQFAGAGREEVLSLLRRIERG
nr:non-ribosomal peptide synthetase [Kibdelosporangium sp. MJ126-NF4]CEL13316.1 Non-ribosomal peptide synthase [Kibdelosporangium sp. MJ126-NF4]CTQ99007.1 Non-ribosomal peptide synthase [Kibdelosporangium sp. MJ126-NF4]